MARKRKTEVAPEMATTEPPLKMEDSPKQSTEQVKAKPVLSIPETKGLVHESSVIVGSVQISRDEYIKMKRHDVSVVVVAGDTQAQNKYYMLPRKI